MAQRDYVARGRKPKQKTPPPKPALPWFRILVTLALVAGFAFFLYSIKNNEETTALKTENSELSEQDSLPDIPEEEWEFIKSLPEYTVEIDVEAQQQSDKRYLMQCGSFRAEAQAGEMKATIAFQGLEAQIRPSDGSSGRWYRVILGPYISKRQAEADRHTLQRAKINSCKIWNWNL